VSRKLDQIAIRATYPNTTPSVAIAWPSMISTITTTGQLNLHSRTARPSGKVFLAFPMCSLLASRCRLERTVRRNRSIPPWTARKDCGWMAVRESNNYWSLRGAAWGSRTLDLRITRPMFCVPIHPWSRKP